MPDRPPRIAVIGHVEHVTIARVATLPEPGAIVHLDRPEVIAGGGGGIALAQLARSTGEIHLYTALGNDDAAREVEAAIRATGATLHAARRHQPHTRDLVLVTDAGERTIYVIGEPLHARRDDDLAWDLLRTCDAAYFTGQDADALVAARAAKLLVVTARRRYVLAASKARADVIVGSTNDPREASTLADYNPPPRALVMTSGPDGGTIETAAGVTAFAAAAPPSTIGGTYGAGDTFAGALTWYLARGLDLPAACERAAKHAAAVLAGTNPLNHQLPLE
jgi:ribokinase